MKVEVFIASWSGTAKYLNECVQSFNSQTRMPDVLLVDESERRAMHKWNERIRDSDADIIAFPGADDVYMTNFLEEMVGYLEAHPECAAVFCHDYIIDAEGNRIGATECKIPKRDKYEYRQVLEYTVQLGNVLRCETFVCRPAMLREKEICWKDICGTANDTALWFDILNHYPIGILDKKLVLYRSHPDSDTQKNVVGTDKVWDSLEALEYANRNKDKSSWIVDSLLERARTLREADRTDARLRDRHTNRKHIRLCIVHESPVNAGTGIMLRERVRMLNSQEDEWMTYFVFPDKEKQGLASVQGIPCIVVKPDNLRALFDDQRPEHVEYHHLWRWDSTPVNPYGPTDLYVHDQWIWCEQIHMVDIDGKLCGDPTGQSCRDRCMVDPKQVPTDFINSMNEIFVHSDYMANMVLKAFGRPARVVPHSVTFFEHQSRKTKFGFFGNFLTVKGAGTLLNAWRHVENAHLVLFSEVPEQFCLGNRLLGFDNVTVFGRYRREDLPHLCQLIDVAVVPSINESYGLIYRELKSLGLPVIATKTGGLDGTLPPGDEKALAEAMQGYVKFRRL